MVMSNCSAPPRASTSSTARAPAMPLPMTTNCCFAMGKFLPVLELDDAEVEHDGAADPGGGAEEHLDLRVRLQIFHHRQRHVDAGLGADREGAGGFAVLH